MSNFLLSVFAKLFSITDSRYVNRFVPVKKELSNGRTKAKNDKEERAYKDLFTSVENIERMQDKYPVIKELDEVLFVKVIDLDDFKLTVILNKGKVTVEIGWDLDKKPSFVLPLYSKNLSNLKKISDDLILDMKDIYRITRVLFIPFLEGLYQGDFSHLPKNKSYLQLDNFIHVEVKDENGIEVEGFTGPALATVINVDGQWMVFKGFYGDPDIKYSMNIKQALEFAYLIRVKLIQADPNSKWSDLKSVVGRYNDLKKKVTVYERSWHTT